MSVPHRGRDGLTGPQDWMVVTSGSGSLRVPEMGSLRSGQAEVFT